MLATRPRSFLLQPAIPFGGMLGRHISPQLQVGHTTSASRSVRSWSQIAALGGDTKANEARGLVALTFSTEKKKRSF